MNLARLKGAQKSRTESPPDGSAGNSPLRLLLRPSHSPRARSQKSVWNSPERPEGDQLLALLPLAASTALLPLSEPSASDPSVFLA